MSFYGYYSENIDTLSESIVALSFFELHPADWHKNRNPSVSQEILQDLALLFLSYFVQEDFAFTFHTR